MKMKWVAWTCFMIAAFAASSVVSSAQVDVAPRQTRQAVEEINSGENPAAALHPLARLERFAAGRGVSLQQVRERVQQQVQERVQQRGMQIVASQRPLPQPVPQQVRRSVRPNVPVRRVQMMPRVLAGARQTVASRPHMAVRGSFQAIPGRSASVRPTQAVPQQFVGAGMGIGMGRVQAGQRHIAIQQMMPQQRFGQMAAVQQAQARRNHPAVSNLVRLFDPNKAPWLEWRTEDGQLVRPRIVWERVEE